MGKKEINGSFGIVVWVCLNYGFICYFFIVSKSISVACLIFIFYSSMMTIALNEVLIVNKCTYTALIFLEREVACEIVKANAIHFDFVDYRAVFLEDITMLRGVLNV